MNPTGTGWRPANGDFDWAGAGVSAFAGPDSVDAVVLVGSTAVPAAPPPVHCVGLVLSDPCGMRDHGRLLAAELRRRGLTVDEHWLVNDGAHLGPALAASWRLLRWAGRPAPGGTVVWHYSSFGFGWRGVPLFGVALGLLLRRRRIRVVTFFHEPVLPWNRRLDRRAVISLTQWLALRLALAGSSVVVATTDQRAARLRGRTGLRHGRVGSHMAGRRGREGRRLAGRRRPVHVIPVFSNIPVVADPPDPPPAGRHPGRAGDPTFTLGVVGYISDGVDPTLLFEALRRLGDGPPVRVRLLGGPGPDSAGADRWRRAAQDAGRDDALEFTGVLPPAELSRCLSACDAVAFLDRGGPSSRKGTLAAALAHGRPVVAVDGPERWPLLVEAGAIRLVTAEPTALADALDDVRRSPEARARLGAAAAAFHDEHQAVERAAARLADLLALRPTPDEARRPLIDVIG